MEVLCPYERSACGKEIVIRVHIVKYLCICMFYTEIIVEDNRCMRGQSPTILIEQEIVIVPQGKKKRIISVPIFREIDEKQT